MENRYLNEDLRKQIREVFADMVQPVRVVQHVCAYKDECETCQHTMSILKELATLSDKLSLMETDVHSPEAPEHSLQIQNAAEPVKSVGFWGMPVGHEFSILVNDLLLVSRGESGLSEPVRNFLASLKTPVRLQVYVTPT